MDFTWKGLSMLPATAFAFFVILYALASFAIIAEN